MCTAWNPICDVGHVLGGAASSVAGSVFDDVAKSFASAAQKLTDWMWTVIAKTTMVDLTGGWFRSMFGITVTLAGLVVTALFALELIKAVLRREPGALARATIGAGAGILGAAASIGVVTALLSVSDALSDGVVRTAGMDGIDKLGHDLAPTAALASIGSPALMLLLAIGYVIASFFVWALFVFRKAMLIVAAVFAPVAFAGAPMRATSGWVRRWVEFTVTMIFAKLVVVILFTLAVSLVGAPGNGFAAVGNLFSGLAMLAIACFAPWLLFRLVHFVGGDVMSAHHQALTQSTIQAGSTPVSLARSGATKVASLAGPGAAGGADARLAGGSGASAAKTAAQTSWTTQVAQATAVGAPGAAHGTDARAASASNPSQDHGRGRGSIGAESAAQLSPRDQSRDDDGSIR
jgi:type IV secretion system protein TrbL